MATIKAFTDISQSKKLAEILPIESADMHYVLIDTDEDKYAAGLGKYIGILHHYPCWSLASLLSVLPEKYTELIKEGGMYRIIIKDSFMTCLFDNPVDACYELILKLHELKML